MKKKNVSKKPPAKVEKVAPAGVSKKKKSSKNGLNIHAVGNIWTPPSSGKDKILNNILNTPDETTNEKKNEKVKDKKKSPKESSKEPGHLLKQGIKFSSHDEFSSNKKSEKKNTKLNEKPKTKRLLQKLKRKRDKKLAKIKKRKGEEVSSPPPHTGAVNPAFNNSIRDAQTDFSPKSNKNQSSSKSIKEVDVSTTDSVHHRLKKDKLKELLKSTAENEPNMSIESTDSKKKEKKKTTSIFDKAKERLASARFRYINEMIYTQTSEQSAKMFKKDPLLFEAYHQGFQQQAKAWKLDPLDMIIDQVKTMPRTSVIADMGCGEARLAKSLQRMVHSFDLVSNVPGVIQCDMSKVPLPDESVDVVVFCLSLMGTNIKEFLLEASRILKEDGLVKIAELESRFPQDKEFIKNMIKYGFKLKKKNLKEEYFVFYDFIKEREPNSRNNLPIIELKPCLYKKR